MSVFDTYSDSPFKIKEEGQEIVVTASRTNATTLQISWTVPQVTSCGDNPAYNGAIITIDTTPITLAKVPVDGTIYDADPTASPVLNAGDRLGTALVVGAFYGDTTTMTLTITDAPSPNPYYVSLHAVDAEYRYHTDGVFSYSLPFGQGNTDQPTNAFQEIRLGSAGVTLATPIVLPSSSPYTFKVIADSFPLPGYSFSFSGASAATYSQLIGTLNGQVVAALNPISTIDNSFPGTGTYWYDASKQVVNLWTGTTTVPQSTLFLGMDPLNPGIAKLWYNTASGNLWLFDVPSTTYGMVPYYNSTHNPHTPYCDDFWYSPTSGILYRWTGVLWELTQVFNTALDPQLPAPLNCFSYWFDGTNLYQRDDTMCIWDLIPLVTSNTDFTMPVTGQLWYNTTTLQLYEWLNNGWSLVVTANALPTAVYANLIYVNPVTYVVQQQGVNGTWNTLPSIALPTDPRDPVVGTVWYDNFVFRIWTITGWVTLPVTNSAVDPTLPPVLVQGSVWYDQIVGTFAKLVGTSWVDTTAVTFVTDVKPQSLTAFIWYNPVTTIFQQFANGMLSTVSPLLAIFDPSAIPDGTMWYQANATPPALKQWFNGMWNVVAFTTTPFVNTIGQIFYDTATSTMYTWNGIAWVVTLPGITFSLTPRGNMRVQSNTLGSMSHVCISDYGNFWNSLTLGIPMEVLWPEKGTDPVSELPSYMEVGVGTDGSQDERRALIERIKHQLGYPVVEVELTKAQMDTAVDNALSELRLRTGNAYKRAVFFMEVKPHQQQYLMTDRTVGNNKIVEIMYLHRMTSAYLGTGIGAGIYGQIAIQQMYTMGKFDLVSYHLVAGYIELMKQMFATELQFGWDEYTRTLSIFKEFYVHERVLVDAYIEKTEQEIITDRWSANWIQKFALAKSRLMLAEIRGKYGSIIAAGGSVTMNAGDLRTTAEREMQECYDDIENYVVNNKEQYGASSDFLIG